MLALRFVNALDGISFDNREIGTEMTPEKPDEMTDVFVARGCIEAHVEFVVKVLERNDTI
jgi:hypothetical protein